LNLEHKQNIEILVGNQAAIAISNNPKTKHFNMKLFFVREVQKNGDVSFCYYKTENQVADILTKPLSHNKVKSFRKKLGVCSI